MKISKNKHYYKFFQTYKDLTGKKSNTQFKGTKSNSN